MGIEFWAIFGVLKANYELGKKIWEYLLMFPEWLNYLQQLNENKAILNRRMEVLSSLVDDINEQLKSEELRSGKKRRREVETWLGHAKRMKSDVEGMMNEITRKKFPPLFESRVAKSLKDAQELCEAGQFPEGLFLKVPSTSKQPFLTQELFGDQKNLETIMEWLSESEVSRIGVYGHKGVGKTTILTHIQSQLSQSSSTIFDHVYWVSLADESSVHKLQNAIAKQVGFDLSKEEDEKIRTAKLHQAISRRGKCVIIVDGVGNLSIEEVGIPNGCKLVISTVSLRCCQKMGCDKNVEIKPLSHDEAVKLFRQKLSLRDPCCLATQIAEKENLIVGECHGLPQCIVNVAKELRGLDDINEWNDYWEKVQVSGKGIAD